MGNMVSKMLFKSLVHHIYQIKMYECAMIANSASPYAEVFHLTGQQSKHQ